MDDATQQEVEPSGQQDDGSEQQQGNYLQAIVDNLTPDERTELSMLLQKSMQQDRQKGTLSLDDEDTGGLTPAESGQSDHMTELGR